MRVRSLAGLVAVATALSLPSGAAAQSAGPFDHLQCFAIRDTVVRGSATADLVPKQTPPFLDAAWVQDQDAGAVLLHRRQEGKSEPAAGAPGWRRGGGRLPLLSCQLPAGHEPRCRLRHPRRGPVRRARHQDRPARTAIVRTGAAATDADVDAERGCGSSLLLRRSGVSRRVLDRPLRVRPEPESVRLPGRVRRRVRSVRAGRVCRPSLLRAGTSVRSGPATDDRSRLPVRGADAAADAVTTALVRFR